MFRKKQSLSLRLWHWANSLVVTLLLITVALRNTLLDVKSNKGLIISKAQELGVALNDLQATGIAREIRNQLWQWHPIIGFVAIALLVFRVVVFFLDKNENKKENLKNKPAYYRWVKRSYLLFYVVLAIMGITGALMYWEDFFHISEKIVDQIQEFHETLMWFIIVFIAAHIAGVVRAEHGADKGIISDMINGGKD